MNFHVRRLRLVVYASTVFKSLVMLVFFALLVKLSFEGFIAGEMGIMAGILIAVAAAIYLPLCVFMLIATIMIFLGKRWALIPSIIYSGIFILLELLLLSSGIIIFAVVFIPSVIMLAAEKMYYRMLRDRPV